MLIHRLIISLINAQVNHFISIWISILTQLTGLIDINNVLVIVTISHYNTLTTIHSIQVLNRNKILKFLPTANIVTNQFEEK